MSILVIVMLGVSFFAGLRAAGPDMKQTADQYFDQQSLMDIRLVSTLGFTEADVADVQAVEGVSYAEPFYTKDVMADSGQAAVVAKVYSLSDKINVPVLIEGRMPEKSGECLAEESQVLTAGFQIGSKLQLTSGIEDEELEDSIKVSEYTVVGIVRSPYYISFERGTTTLGSGEINTFLIIPKDDFAMDVYTDIFLTVDGAVAKDTFSPEYKEAVDAVAKALEEQGKGLAQRRYDQVYRDAEAELADGKADMDRELSDAQADIDQAEADLEQGRKDLEKGKKEYDSQIADGEKQLDQAEKKLEQGEQEYKKNKKAFDQAEPAALKAIEDGERELAEAKKELDEAKVQLDALEQTIQTGLMTEDMKAQYQAEYDKGMGEYRQGLAQYNQGVKDLEAGKEQLAQGKQALQGAEQQLAQGRKDLKVQRKKLDDLKALIASGTLTEAEQTAYEAELEKGEAAYTEAKGQLDETEKTLKGKRAELEQAEKDIQAAEQTLKATKTQLDQAKAQLDGLKATIDSGKIDPQTLAALKETYGKAKKEYDEGYAQYKQGLETLNQSKEKLDSGRKQLAQAKTQLDQGKAQLKKSRKTFEEEKAKGRQELDDAEQKIAAGQEDLAEGKREYEKAKREGEEEIADAEQKIADGREELQDIPEGKWYVFDREDNSGVSEYEHAAERMDAMAQIFPMIFLVVAALVCLNTMTRMVDEQRTYIGTVKGLGYSNGAIGAKYILYAAIASVIGSVVGVAGGIRIFPQVIFNAYGIMFTLPPIQLNFYPETALVGAGAAIAVTTLAAFIGCKNSLRANPAKLMRPKAPKAGKRVLLERIGFIWKRLSFTGKVTVRNLFRYKKRFIMTVFGITGSMALLLTGFGVKDSVSNILVYQFEDINRYELVIGIDGDAEALERQAQDICGTKETIAALNKTVDVGVGGEKMSVTLVVPEDASKFAAFIDMRGRLDGEKVPFQSSVLTEKAAYKTGAVVGQDITVYEGDSDQYQLPLAGETENYAGHYLYLTKDLYGETWGQKPEYNCLYVRVPEGADREKMAEDLLKLKGVVMLSFMDDVAKDFTDMIDTLNYVVMVLIVSAAALTFLILYNLTNLNVSERYREISTLKVLGFYDKEVLSYVYRENFILTFIGIVIGCFCGIALHYYIITTVEVDAVMFGRTINFISFVWSVLLVILFALSVNFVMFFKLRKINMVEALKSVE